MKPAIGKYPIEVFGHVYNDCSETAIVDRDKQYCPYIKRECNKPRKSEPKIKVGICTVGYQGSFLSESVPVIICPNRFLEDIVFDTIREKFFPDWENVSWIKEVNIGVGGNVDFVAAKTDETGTDVMDFLCVEFQANGTTGSPYPYVRDLLQDGEYSRNYTFGLNWANEFMKTMMQQVYKKGKIINHWNKKIVFVIQDVALSYLESAVDTADLRSSMDDDIHFVTFKLEWNDTDSRFQLKPDRWKSTDLDGINKILGGANKENYLAAADFIKNIEAKGKGDGSLNV